MGETFTSSTGGIPAGSNISSGPTLAQQEAMAGGKDVEVHATTPGGGGRISITPQESADYIAGNDADSPEPDKFEGKSREEIIASYQELEKMGAKPNQTADEASNATAAQAAGKAEPDAGIPEPTAEGAPQANANQGVIESLTEEYAQSGEISAESREAFTKATGLPDSLIDDHIAGVQRTETDNMAAAQSIAGGEEAYAEMIAWASETLNESEREAYNSAVFSRNPDLAAMAVEGLKARFSRENGVAPNLVAGNRPNYGGVEAFQSEFEWTEARRSPQYAKDPNFRKQVEARLKRSMELGLL